MPLRRGAANAQAERNCRACRNRNHHDCAVKLALQALSEYRESGFPEEDAPQVPFCACYYETDLHI